MCAKSDLSRKSCAIARSLKYRSTEEELLDQPNIAAADLHRNLHELDVINRLLGGHAATLAGLKHLMHDRSRTYRIIDLGCGGGDTLLAIDKWASRKGFNVELTGLDLLPDAIEYAEKACAGRDNINFVCSDFNNFSPAAGTYDIAVCALFCHHLYDDELTALLTKMREIGTLGAVVNDLHRHWFGYYNIMWLTSVLSKSHLVKNDAPLSVARGFSRAELQAELTKAGWQPRLKWIWAFRWLALHTNPNG